jgi:hypothetical protein
MRLLGGQPEQPFRAEPERLWRRYLVDDWAILRFLVRERRQSREARATLWQPRPPV